MDMNKLKKITAMVLTLAILCTLCPIGTLANTGIDTSVTKILTTTDGYYEYKIEGPEIMITRYKGNQNEITIPDTIDGKKVTTIGVSAFSDCNSLTSITIPDSVTTIEYCAFYFCSNLTSITIPDSVTTIRMHVFWGCRSLTSITIPDSVTIIDFGTFRDCTNLTNVSIPNSVTTIRHRAFGNCTSLTNITIPDSVTNINDFAFYGCTSLTDITIADNVTTILNYAFNNCTSLADVYFEGSKEQWNNIKISEGNECLTNATIHFNSIKKDDTLAIARTKISVPNKTYTGNQITPTVTVTNGKTKLHANTDYTIMYGTNKATGKGTVTITGKGKYVGEVTKTFKILPRKTDISLKNSSKGKFTVSIAKKSEAVKYKIQYTDNPKFKNAKIKTVSAKTTKATLTGKSNTTYYVRVSVIGNDGTSSGWSSFKKIKVT